MATPPSLSNPKRKLDTGTGPALQAFGALAVKFGYIPQFELDRIYARLGSIDSDHEREAATVAALRRFICKMQPLGLDVELVGCPTRHKEGPGIDLNGLPASVDPSAPPGGTPEVYNVAVQLPEDDEPRSIVCVEPKYLRPSTSATRDERAEKVPEDHQADAWYEALIAHHEKHASMFGSKFGPARPK